MTLTEMIRENLKMEPENDTQARAIEDTLNTIKWTFKEWLETVGLPNYQSYGKGGVPISASESIRKLLITLVDEP